MTRKRIDLKRRMLGRITQTEVARRLNITVEQVNRVLNGHRESRRVITAIENFLDQIEREETTTPTA